ncbi:MAG: epimerase [Cellulosimicrobium sp.]|jgi:putative membrane protein|nr:epimerase [Cellulosimicrobium sp.]
MIGVGLALAGVAAAIHVYIFVMESLTWTSARTRATFGTSREEAEATQELAFNQGFYNLFLAVLVVLGIVLYATDRQDVGLTLVVAGAGSMVAAGLVLILSSPSKARAALVQLVPPLLGVVGVVVGLTS